MSGNRSKSQPSSSSTYELCGPMNFAMNFAALYALLTFAANSAFGTGYNLDNNIVGSGFYDAFVFEVIGDPTHGRVYANSTPQSSLSFTAITSGTMSIRIRQSHKTLLTQMATHLSYAPTTQQSSIQVDLVATLFVSSLSTAMSTRF